MFCAIYTSFIQNKNTAMSNMPQHFLLSTDSDVDIAAPQVGNILRANAAGRWQPFGGEVDGLLAVPTDSTLQRGFITLRYISGVVILYVNDGGVIKQLALGEPA